MIRKAEPRDIERVLELMRELEQSPIDEEGLREIYMANLAASDVHYMVCDFDGKVCGFISLHIQKLLHHAANIAEVQELIVEESKRGRGIGRALFASAEAIAEKESCAQIEVCCNINRLNSHAFYRAMGMQNRHYKFSKKA